MSAAEGDDVSVAVRAVNPNDSSNAGPASASSETITLLAATGDADGDGMGNADEAIAGTNPLDNSSRFQVDSTTVASGGDVTINWTVPAPDRSYTIQTSTTLAPGSWSTLATGLTEGNYTDTSAAAAEDKKFYRVVVE